MQEVLGDRDQRGIQHIAGGYWLGIGLVIFFYLSVSPLLDSFPITSSYRYYYSSHLLCKATSHLSFCPSSLLFIYPSALVFCVFSMLLFPICSVTNLSKYLNSSTIFWPLFDFSTSQEILCTGSVSHFEYLGDRCSRTVLDECTRAHLVKSWNHSNMNISPCHDITLWTSCACLSLCWTWPPPASLPVKTYSLASHLSRSNAVLLHLSPHSCLYYYCFLSFLISISMLTLLSHSLMLVHLHLSSALSAWVRF